MVLRWFHGNISNIVYLVYIIYICIFIFKCFKCITISLYKSMVKSDCRNILILYPENIYWYEIINIDNLNIF